MNPYMLGWKIAAAGQYATDFCGSGRYGLTGVGPHVPDTDGEERKESEGEHDDRR